MEIELNWTSFFSIDKLRYSKFQEYRGVYIWGFDISNDFIPYYIGMADNIEYRLFEHINFLLGGKYAIFHKDSLKDFYKYKNSKQNDVNEKGLIYIPYWPEKYYYFIKQRKQLQPHIDYMIEKFTYSYAKISDKVNRKELKSIESICINKIGKEFLINTCSGYSNRFKLNHSGNKKMIEIFNKY